MNRRKGKLFLNFLQNRKKSWHYSLDKGKKYAILICATGKKTSYCSAKQSINNNVRFIFFFSYLKKVNKGEEYEN